MTRWMASGVVLALMCWTVGAQSPADPAATSRAAPAAAASRTSVLQRGDVGRGRYLVEHVAMCGECHSERDDRGNIIEGQRFMGGPIPPGPPWAREWAVRAPRNAGLPGYSDADALRLLTEGAINREGRQLQPPMPRYRMTPEDAADVIAFMRSIT